MSKAFGMQFIEKYGKKYGFEGKKPNLMFVLEKAYFSSY